MKKLILICTIFFATINLYAQSNSEKMGDAAFSMGNYADAIELYDAAAILSKDRTTEIQTKRSKAARCLSLKKKGDSLYASKEYEESKSKYQQLKSLNPSDKSVNDKLARLDKLIAERRSQEAKAEKMAQIENSYYDALKIGIVALKKFCIDYPKSEQVGKAQLLINILEQNQYVSKADETALYNSIGKDFEKIGNVVMSQKLYDYSASHADPQGLYLKAMTYKTGSKEQITLMAMSASSGYKQAIEKLNGVKYNSKIADIYYTHLKNYRKNLHSAIFLKENLQTYYLDYIDPGKYIMADKMLSFNLTDFRSLEVDGNVAYYIADVVKDDARFVDARITLLYYAASNGNADAAYQLAKLASLDENPNLEMINALYMCAINGGVAITEKSWETADVRNYVSFMKNGKANDSFDLYLIAEYPKIHFGVGVIDKHEALLNCCQMGRSSFYYKYFKRLWENQHEGVWDKAYIERVINYLSGKNDSFSKKMLKKVSKLTIKDDQYKSELAEFIKDGFVDNQYRYSCPSVKCDVLQLKVTNDFIGENGIVTR